MRAAPTDADIDVPIRLDDDVLLKLAKTAHTTNVKLNDLCVAILADYVLHPRGRSRNAREGRFVGCWRGQQVRCAKPLFNFRQPFSEVAWIVASQRAGQPLPVRRPRYLTKGVHHE